MDTLPRKKLTRSQRKNRDVKTCAWAQLLGIKTLTTARASQRSSFERTFASPTVCIATRGSITLSTSVFVLHFGPTRAYKVQTDSSSPNCLNQINDDLCVDQDHIDCVETTTKCLARSRRTLTHLLVLRCIIGYRTRLGTLPFAGQGMG